MGLGNLVTKATGLGALYLSIIDAHRIGMAGKNKAPQTYVAKNYPDEYINSQRLNIQSLPTIVSGLKRSWFATCLDDNWIPAMKGVTGYISGLYNGLVMNIVPVLLGVGALASKRFGKYCAIGLGLNLAKILAYDVCSIGKPKQL